MPNKSIENARRLRRESTDAEDRLWFHLRDRRLCGLKFRRQQPIGRYIVDFCCPAHKLIVEVDGGQHAEQVDYDLRRTAHLRRCGFRVLRFWNFEVMETIDDVLEEIAAAVGIPSP